MLPGNDAPEIDAGRTGEFRARQIPDSDLMVRSLDEETTGGETGSGTQPRPALGRRPWFALLRRARSLRRFALAMGRRLPVERREHRIDTPGTITSVGGGWTHTPTVLAASHRIRRVGLRPLSCGLGLVIRASSVHGIGMVEDLTLIGVSADGVVVRCATLSRGSIVCMPDARFVIELPGHIPGPQRGDRLVYLRGGRPAPSGHPPIVGS